MKEPLILVGGGGHCRSVIDVIEAEGKHEIVGIVDLPEKMGNRVLGYEIVAADERLPEIIRKYRNVLVTIGQIKSSVRRVEKFLELRKLGARFPVIISPMSRVSRHAIVGEGTVVMHFALVNAGARVGTNCILNSQCLLEHDAVVEDHCHISTGALVNGGAVIGRETFIGSNAVIRDNIVIGPNCVVGAGTSVMRDLAAGSVVKS